jgi:cytidylate kinase
MPVITIARQYGAGGSTIAAIVAERLGANLVDKWLIAEVARRAQLAPESVEAEDEHPSSLLGRLVAAFAPMGVAPGMVWDVPYPDPAYDPRLAVLELTRKVVTEVARGGNAVIVGRGGAAILRERRDAVHVFLYAAEPARVDTVMAREAVSESVARRRMHEMDANRAAYLRQAYGLDRRDPLLYTLQCNTGLLGYARTVEIILAAADGLAEARAAGAALARESSPLAHQSSS